MMPNKETLTDRVVLKDSQVPLRRLYEKVNGQMHSRLIKVRLCGHLISSLEAGNHDTQANRINASLLKNDLNSPVNFQDTRSFGYLHIIFVKSLQGFSNRPFTQRCIACYG
ncbi:MAG: hypothetical protein AAFY26_11055 [Cyanobacteria bacterium J06638_22]